MKIVFVTSLKGGVGKSFIASGIAKYLSKKGFSTVLIDADVDSPNISEIFPIEKKLDDIQLVQIDDNLYCFSFGYLFDAVSMSSRQYVNMIKDLLHLADVSDVDYIIFDMPAGASDIAKFLFNYPGVAVTVGIPDRWKDLERMLTILNIHQVACACVVENFAGVICSNCGYYNEYDDENFVKVCEKFKVPIACKIPISDDIKLMVESGFEAVDVEEFDYFKKIVEYVDKTEPMKKLDLSDIVEVVRKKLPKIVAKTIKEINKRKLDLGIGGTINELIILHDGKVILSFVFEYDPEQRKIIVHRDANKKIDCRIFVELETLIKIILGYINVETAYLMGQIYTEGVVMKKVIKLFRKLSDQMRCEISQIIKQCAGLDKK
ncbi:P-loop NTPase [Methanocaldococcus sp.]